MGGSGSGYGKNKHAMTEEEMKKKHKAMDGDSYIFDVEYQKIKKEQERLQREYEKARAEYLRITERLRQEMLGGVNNESFIAGLTDLGVQLQRQQQQLQGVIDNITDQRSEVDKQMNDLRLKAFPGQTRAVVNRDDYKGFDATKNGRGVNYANAKVVEMSPAEYLRRIAFDVKGGGLDELLNHMSPQAVEKYARQMLRGTKFNMPSMNYRGRTSTGEARVMASLLNGYDRIPVLVVE